MPQFVRTFLVEFIFLGLVAGLYLLNPGVLPLESGSELFDVEAARETLISTHWFKHWMIPHFNGLPLLEKPPLMVWLNSVALGLFGIKLASARLVAVVLSLATLVLTYLLSMSMFKSRSKALLSAVILVGTWGFFKLSHFASADILYTPLLLGFFIVFQAWNPTPSPARRKSLRADTTQISLLFGALLGLLFLAHGPVGVLLPLIVVLAFWIRQGAVDNLALLNWKKLSLGFFALTLPWLLTACILQGGPDPLVKLLAFPLMNAPGGVPQVDWQPLFHLKSLWLRLLPWLFFPLALLFDAEHSRSLKDQGRDAMMLMVFWFVAGLLLISLLGWQEETDMLWILPPFAILAGLYAGHYAETNVFSPVYRWATDLGIVCIMVGAILTAVLFFQILPDNYATEFWTLPGAAMFQAEVDEMALQFPIWKLWLIPGPLILLAGGVALYIFRMSERPQAVVLTMGATLLTFFLFLKGVYLPAIHRPVIPMMAQSASRLAGDARMGMFIYDPAYDLTSAVFYLRPNLLPATILTSGKSALLERLLLKRSGQGGGTYGLIKDRDYYRIEPGVRKYLRVVRSNWLWDLEQRAEFYKALRNVETDFEKMTYRVLLVEVLPQAVIDETEDPALHMENLEQPVDTVFEATPTPEEI